MESGAIVQGGLVGRVRYSWVGAASEVGSDGDDAVTGDEQVGRLDAAFVDKGGAGEAGAAAPAEASDDSSDDDAAEEAAEEPAEATAEATEDNVADAGDTEDSAGEADGDNTEEE